LADCRYCCTTLGDEGNSTNWKQKKDDDVISASGNHSSTFALCLICPSLPPMNEMRIKKRARCDTERA
jgi:hypothetical protein